MTSEPRLKKCIKAIACGNTYLSSNVSAFNAATLNGKTGLLFANTIEAETQ